MARSTLPALTWALVVGALTGSCCLAQGQSAGPADKASAAVQARIGDIDVRQWPRISAHLDVRDAAGRFIPSIRHDDVRVEFAGLTSRSNGRPDFQLSSFSTTGRSLCSLLLIDQSGSMKRIIPQCRQAALAFASHLSPNDLVGLQTFGVKVVEAVSPTADRSAFAAATDRIGPTQQDTAIIDSVSQATRTIIAAPGDKRAVVVLSDGKDNSSQHSPGEAIRAARDASVLLCCVALGPRVDASALRKLAEGSGGIYRRASSPDELAELYREIAVSLHDEYILDADLSDVTREKEWYELHLQVRNRGRSAEATRRFLADPAPPMWTASTAGRGADREVMAGVIGTVLAALAIGLAAVARARHA